MIGGMYLVDINLPVSDGQLTGLVLNMLPECFVNFQGLECTHWGSCGHFAGTEPVPPDPSLGRFVRREESGGPGSGGYVNTDSIRVINKTSFV